MRAAGSGTLKRVGQSVYEMTKSALDYLTQTLAGAVIPLDGGQVIDRE